MVMLPGQLANQTRDMLTRPYCFKPSGKTLDTEGRSYLDSINLLGLPSELGSIQNYIK